MAKSAPKVSAGAEFVSAGQVMSRYGGVSHMWIVRAMKDDGFPKPVRFGSGRLRFWRLDELRSWEADAIARARVPNE